jgi:hypothetical protein
VEFHGAAIEAVGQVVAPTGEPTGECMELELTRNKVASIRGMRVDGVDLFSVYDFIKYVCPGHNSIYARQLWNRAISHDKWAHVVKKCHKLKFEGKGQRKTPCMTIYRLQKLLLILGIKAAVEFHWAAIEAVGRVVAPTGEPPGERKDEAFELQAKKDRMKAYCYNYRKTKLSCISCRDWPDWRNGHQHHCYRCFCEKFPTHERVRTKVRVELQVRAFIDRHFQDFVHDRPLRTAHATGTRITENMNESKLCVLIYIQNKQKFVTQLRTSCCHDSPALLYCTIGVCNQTPGCRCLAQIVWLAVVSSADGLFAVNLRQGCRSASASVWGLFWPPVPRPGLRPPVV